MMAVTLRSPPGLSDAVQRVRSLAAPAWLADLRALGWSTFEKKGLPSPQDEDWRYTDLAPLLKHAWTPGAEASVGSDELAPFVIPGLSGPRLVFVNGRFAPSLSDLGHDTRGFLAGSLLGATTPPALASTEPSALEALNAALVPDVAFVRVQSKARLEEPITLLHLTVARDAPTMNHVRTLVEVGARAEASFVEVYAGLGKAPAWTNAVTLLRAGDDAVVDRTVLQRHPTDVFHTSVARLELGRNANVTDHVYAWGAALTRNDLAARFGGEGGEAVLNGLYAPTGTQHVDNHTLVDHAVPHCTSQEFYKGILDGRARGIFYGKVLIRKDAQKTHAAQTNNNLILSREALADSTPALEINADDVKASHGSTTGQLDANSLFYLRARGLDADTARSLLTYAFARDVIARVKHAPLRAHLDSLLLQRLPNGGLVKEVLHEAQA